jgi:hypothetical protein
VFEGKEKANMPDDRANRYNSIITEADTSEGMTRGRAEEGL